MMNDCTMTLYDEYVAVLEEQRKLYGPSTIVLFEVGTFWEMLDCDEHRGCDVPKLAAVLNIQATRRNKGILAVSKSNNSLAGFNTSSLAKYLPVLVSALYTVVLVSEVATPVKGRKDAVISRHISRIVSKGTWIDDVDLQPNTSCVSQRIACMCMQYVGVRLVGCGVASLDLRTGRSDACETCCVDAQDCNAVFDSVCAATAGMDIIELLIVGDTCKEIVARLGVTGIVHDLSGRPSVFSKPLFQDVLLRKAYRQTGFLTAAEFVGLERSALALTAFVGLLDFAHRHDETILHNLPVPTVGNAPQDGNVKVTGGAVLLSPTTLKDLDILTASGSGLSALLNECVTGMGRRMFHERITCPVSDVNVLQARYDVVECLMLKPEFTEQVRAELRGVIDIERTWRRLTSSATPHKTGPSDVLQLRSSLQHVRACVTTADSLIDIDTVLLSLAVLDEEGLMSPGLFADVDQARDQVSAYASSAAVWRHAVQSRLGPARICLVKFAPNEDVCPCAHAICTVKRFEEVRRMLGEELTAVIDESAVRIRFTGAAVRSSACESTAARVVLDNIVAGRWKELVGLWTHTHGCGVIMARIVQLTAELDVNVCVALDAARHSMVRPSLPGTGEGEGEGSMVRCEGLRHPLTERLQQQTMYVPNTVVLQSGGVLLYGVNASGKSCLSKALALAVLMAQAGMFVACRDMTLAPFKKVMTRMASRDDIVRGRSTFEVELLELRDILHRADSCTLVVGDELCSGTESASAISIVGAVCLHLVQAGSCFLLATHLHELSRLSQTGSNPAICVLHLGVRYDPCSDSLIYERKLLEGPGKALYGLEVARAMHMPAAFMVKAHEIRREVIGVGHNLASHKTSRFNPAVSVDMCGLCGDKPAQETHHIVPQRDADMCGLVPATDVTSAFHKDAAHNLIPLCRQCHLDVHCNKVVVNGYITTSKGVRLSSARL